MERFITKCFSLPIVLRIKTFPFLNRLLLRGKNVEYGHNCVIYGKLYVINSGGVKIGDDFMMTSGDCINPICRNIRGCFYTEPGAQITIGDRVGMSSTALWCAKSINIGNDVNIGGNCLIIDTDSHPIDWKMRDVRHTRTIDAQIVRDAIKSAPIVIEDNAWIGANCIVMKGVTIGARSVIGAGSVVTKSIPADCIAAGNPARVIKSLNNRANESKAKYVWAMPSAADCGRRQIR